MRIHDLEQARKRPTMRRHAESFLSRLAGAGWAGRTYGPATRACRSRCARQAALGWRGGLSSRRRGKLPTAGLRACIPDLSATCRPMLLDLRPEAPLHLCTAVSRSGGAALADPRDAAGHRAAHGGAVLCLPRGQGHASGASDGCRLPSALPPCAACRCAEVLCQHRSCSSASAA